MDVFLAHSVDMDIEVLNHLRPLKLVESSWETL